MDSQKKINELEYRIFSLEKNMDLMNQKMIQLKDTLAFYYEEPQKKPENLNMEHLLSTKEACDILNINESKLKELIDKKIINDKRIGNMSYFDKKELKILFRKMMIQDSE